MAERSYYQAPAPFELPSEAVVAGRRFTGHRARVYHLLRLTRERRHRHAIGRHLGPPGKVPVFLLREPWSGGQSGGRRARELREYGLELRITTFEPPDGMGSSTTLYELVERAGVGDAGTSTLGTRPAALATTPAAQSSVAADPATSGAWPKKVRLQRQLEPGAVDLTPRPPAPGEARCVVAPSWLVGTPDDYRRQLAEAAEGGHLLRGLPSGPVVLAAPQTALDELGFDPLPVLGEALAAAGVAVETPDP